MSAKRQVSKSRRLPVAMALGVFSALGCAAVLEAGEVEVTFSGVLIEVTEGPPEMWPWGDAVAGDSWSLTYVFETTTGDANPSPHYGSYSAIVSATLTVDGISADTLFHQDIVLTNDNPVDGKDEYAVFTVFSPVAPLEVPVECLIDLTDYTGSALATDALPLCNDIHLPSFVSWRELRVHHGGEPALRGSVDAFVCGPHETETDCNENGIPDAAEWVSTHTFCIEPCPPDCSDGTEWSLEVRFPGGPVFAQANCTAVPPAGSTELEMAHGLVDCINATICSGMTATLYPGQPCFTVNVPGPEPIELCVGPAGGPADCCIESAPDGWSRPVCPFNPTLAHVMVVNEDCNENQIEDGIDIALGTSSDDNEDGIPDECGACCTVGGCTQTPDALCTGPSKVKYNGDGTICNEACPAGIPAVSVWGMLTLTWLVLSAGTIVLRRRPLAA